MHLDRKTCFTAGFVTAVLGASPAYAHTFGATGAGFVDGIGHPFGGFDHLLAMVTVGLWAVQAGGRAMLAVPLTFIGMMVSAACWDWKVCRSRALSLALRPP